MCQVGTGLGDAETNKAPTSLSKDSQSREGDPGRQS